MEDAYSRSASMNSYAWFGQDTIEIGRLTLRPGLRVSHDDLTGNIEAISANRGLSASGLIACLL